MDELSYLEELSSMNPKLFIPIVMMEHLSGILSLAYIGNGIQSIKEPVFIILS